MEFPERAGLRRRGSLRRSGRPGFRSRREHPFFRPAVLGKTQSGVSKPLNAELQASERRREASQAAWGLRGGAQGSQNQALVPLEDPGMNAEGRVGVRPLLPGPLPSPRGGRRGQPELRSSGGSGEARSQRRTRPAGAHLGRLREGAERGGGAALPSPCVEWGTSPREGKRSFLFLFPLKVSLRLLSPATLPGGLLEARGGPWFLRTLERSHRGTGTKGAEP